MTIIVNPFEGFGITKGGGWSASHQGQDYQTPRVYDYTAASDGVVQYVGGPYNSIIVKAPNGQLWRLAEVATILVAKGQTIYRGQVIGRNALHRGGIYRSPHLNGGGDTGRRPFTEIVTHTKAQAAAADAAAAAPKGNQRTVKAGINAVRRMGPGTSYAVAGEVLKQKTVGNFIAFAHGSASQGQPAGNDVWYQGISGHWFWSGSFTTIDGTGLIDKTAEFAGMVVTPAPTPQPELPTHPVVEEPVMWEVTLEDADGTSTVLVQDGGLLNLDAPEGYAWVDRASGAEWVPSTPIHMATSLYAYKAPEPEPELPPVVEPEKPVEPPVVVEPETPVITPKPEPSKPASKGVVGGVVGAIILAVSFIVAAVAGLFD